MEIKVVRLNNSDFLELSISDNQYPWTRVSLVTASGKTLLGADAYSVIWANLKTALQPIEVTNFVGQIDGVSVVNLLNLSENHYSLYLGKTAEGHSILFFSNSEGVLTNSLILDINLLEKELKGTGSYMRGQGASIDPSGNVVPRKSDAAHWPIKQ